MPKHYKNIFYSYSMDELNNFSEIASLTKELAKVPANLDQDYFYKKLQKKSYFHSRNEVYKEPRLDEMLAREAREVLQKNMPQLKRIIGEKASIIQKSDQLIRTYLGHFSVHSASELDELQQAVNRRFKHPCKLIGDFLYPRGGYRGWHTNKYEGDHWSMFLVQVDQAERSCFRFIHPDTGEMITSWDYPNSVNFFRTSSKRVLWHCIASEQTNRWSQGFLVPEDWQSYI